VPGAAFVAGKRYRLDDRAPYAWRTADYGRTWTRITGGSRPATTSTRFAKTRAGRPAVCGTEHGVYVSFDAGARWQSLSLNLPDTQVPTWSSAHDLVIATHGRSFYVLDGIDALRQADQVSADAAAHLFVPGPAVRRSRPAIRLCIARGCPWRCRSTSSMRVGMPCAASPGALARPVEPCVEPAHDRRRDVPGMICGCQPRTRAAGPTYRVRLNRWARTSSRSRSRATRVSPR
jgi:hypothetical protein